MALWKPSCISISTTANETPPRATASRRRWRISCRHATTKAYATAQLGGAAGSGDAANLLKPALARGELRTIAATTWSEYKKYFEKDAALARRFQLVQVEEPDEEKAMVMMRAIAPFLEKHHKVMITDEALLDAVRLSHRYLTARQLPDKAVSVLDTSCARVAIGQTTIPNASTACSANSNCARKSGSMPAPVL